MTIKLEEKIDKTGKIKKIIPIKFQYKCCIVIIHTMSYEKAR